MNFNKRVHQILQEAGGYLTQTSQAKSPEEAIKQFNEYTKILQKNAQHLKQHTDAFEIDLDSYNKVREIINTLEVWGKSIKDKQGRSINVNEEIKKILELTNTPQHDYKQITPDTKLTQWKPIYRKWFALYTKFFPFKATDRRSMSQAQRPEANEIFYFGTDGLPYVTRMSFDADDTVDGTIFLRTNRFNDIQVDQLLDQEGKVVRPMRFEGGKQKGSIPLNAKVEKVFGQKEISRKDLKKVLNSDKAEKAFQKRLKADSQLKAWYDKKYSRVNLEKV